MPQQNEMREKIEDAISEALHDGHGQCGYECYFSPAQMLYLSTNAVMAIIEPLQAEIERLTSDLDTALDYIKYIYAQ